MRRDLLLNRLNSLETLETRLIPTSLALSGVVAMSVISTCSSAQPDDDDPPPEPEPAPPPYPGDDPPIDYPILPPLGPDGPGS
jgi:hypothetical protein